MTTHYVLWTLKSVKDRTIKSNNCWEPTKKAVYCTELEAKREIKKLKSILPLLKRSQATW